MRYAFWNNKGGVGKTFLCYLCAVEYATMHPERCVTVVDMCPQANISEMILGGNGAGADVAEKIYADSKTISHYVAKRLARPMDDGLMGDEINYFVQPSDFNPNMPANLKLVAGSIDLDMYSKAIEFFANSGAQMNIHDAWKRIKLWLKLLLDSFEGNNISSAYTGGDFFIDCNPSFASYTELALIASNRLIIPCTADGSSVRALNNVFKLVYGTDNFGIASFNSHAKEFKIVLPKVFCVVNNQHRTSSRSSIDDSTARMQKTTPDSFCREMREGFVRNIKDCNTLAPIMSYNGLPLSSLQSKKYKVYENDTQANQSQIDALKEDINSLVSEL